ncbi:MAG TPA: hypothetical protein VK891_16800 [Euzebyales bacterium]|nr:hypothetical protein [Euzebyales bacterium]
MGKAQDGELARLRSEFEDAQPYLDLARTIRREVERVADDTTVQADALAELIDDLPRQERLRVAQAVFDRLPPERQWEIIARVFGDEELAALLETERAARLDEARRTAAARALADDVRAHHRLDTRCVPAHGVLTLGLFREADVRAAVARGHLSSTCARRLMLRAVGEPGTFQVIEDVFNPRGGYFVTAQYDEDTWRASDRLRGHAVVRAGSITTSEDGARSADRSSVARFEPVLYPGGRVDFEIGGRLREGRLHLGFAMLGDHELLAG